MIDGTGFVRPKNSIGGQSQTRQFQRRDEPLRALADSFDTRREAGSLAQTEVDALHLRSMAKEKIVGTPEKITIQTLAGEKLGGMSLQVAIDSALSGSTFGAGGPVIRRVLRRDLPQSRVLLGQAKQPRDEKGRFQSKEHLTSDQPNATIEITRRNGKVETAVRSDQEIPLSSEKHLRVSDYAVSQGKYGKSVILRSFEGTTVGEYTEWNGPGTAPAARLMEVPEQLGFLADTAGKLLEAGVDNRTTEGVLTGMVNGIGLSVSADFRGAMSLKVPDEYYLATDSFQHEGVEYRAGSASSKAERLAIVADTRSYRSSYIR